MTMCLNDFLPFIQLAAGLNVAYIAVGITQGYTHILLNNIFNIKQLIQTKFDPIKAIIKINQETLEHTVPTVVDGKSTYDRIERVKREYEILNDTISRSEKEIENRANGDCEFRCFSGLSLIMFLYCCTLLFIAPFYSSWFLLPFTLLLLIYSSWGWFSEKSKYVCNLIWVIAIYLISLGLSSIIFGICKYANMVTICNIWHDLLVIVSSLLPMVNFVIFFVKTFSKMKSIKSNIEAQANSIIQQSDNTNRNFELLKNLEQLKMEID